MALVEIDSAWLECKIQGKMPGVKVISVSVEPAAGRGEGYASELVRICATLILPEKGTKKNMNTNDWPNNKTVSKYFILKKEMEDQIWSSLHPFPREVKMLTEILPILENILLEGSYSKDESSIGPRCLGYSTNFNEIIMEDLKVEGYACVDKFRGWTLREAKAVIRALGRIHAASVVAVSRNLLNHNDLERYGFAQNLSVINDIYGGALSFLASIIQKHWEPEWLCVSRWLLEKSKTLGHDLMKLRDEDPQHLIVLNHGDLWINNVMLRFENDQLASLRFIDFQISNFGSLGWDLVFFFNTDITEKLIVIYHDQLLEAYCSSFDECLNRLHSKFKAPSINDVKAEIERLEFLGLLNAAGDVPLLMSPPDESMSYSDVTHSTGDDALAAKELLYIRPKYTAFIKRVLTPLKERLSK